MKTAFHRLKDTLDGPSNMKFDALLILCVTKNHSNHSFVWVLKLQIEENRIGVI